MGELIHEIVINSAQRFASRTAFRYYDQSLTYRELDETTNSLAQQLIALGVKKGDCVGLYLQQSLNSVIAIFGILKAGAAFVPLDPLLPENRLEYLINNCDINCLITEKTLFGKLQAIADNCAGLNYYLAEQKIEHPTSLEYINWNVAIEPSELPPPQVDLNPSDIAYIMHTSGSTGAPKGLTHTHSSGLSYARAVAELYRVQSTDIISGHSPFHFDVSLFGLFAAPLMGACTVIIPYEYKMLPASLSELIQDERMTIWFSVTTAMVELVVHGDLNNRDFANLRLIKYSGEVFPPKHLTRLREIFPKIEICNVYGPAEVNQCTYFYIPPLPNKFADNDVPIGEVWEAAEALIVDGNDQPVAPGVSGELLIYSSTCMKGYWKQPDLTQASFLNLMGKRFYRTGDVFKYDEEGLLRFLGRKDRQIKIRGHRIELDELELALLAHPSVEKAAVFTLGEGTKLSIAAAVTLTVLGSISSIELLTEISKNIPKYALPSTLKIFDKLPLTGSGKIDRKALKREFLKS